MVPALRKGILRVITWSSRKGIWFVVRVLSPNILFFTERTFHSFPGGAAVSIPTKQNVPSNLPTVLTRSQPLGDYEGTLDRCAGRQRSARVLLTVLGGSLANPIMPALHLDATIRWSGKSDRISHLSQSVGNPVSVSSSNLFRPKIGCDDSWRP